MDLLLIVLSLVSLSFNVTLDCFFLIDHIPTLFSPSHTNHHINPFLDSR